jgi:transcriptional regulator with XRE-family HTH domain
MDKSEFIKIQIEDGNRMLSIMKEKNLTKSDVCRMSGMSRRLLDRVLSGKHEYTFISFLRVCKVLGINNF